MIKAIVVITTTIAIVAVYANWVLGLLKAGHWYAVPLLLAATLAVAWVFDTPEDRASFTQQVKALGARLFRQRPRG